MSHTVWNQAPVLWHTCYYLPHCRWGWCLPTRVTPGPLMTRERPLHLPNFWASPGQCEATTPKYKMSTFRPHQKQQTNDQRQDSQRHRRRYRDMFHMFLKEKTGPNCNPLESKCCTHHWQSAHYQEIHTPRRQLHLEIQHRIHQHTVCTSRLQNDSGKCRCRTASSWQPPNQRSRCQQHTQCNGEHHCQ